MNCKTFIVLLFCFLITVQAVGQTKSYTIHYGFVGKDSLFLPKQLGLQQMFASKEKAVQFISSLPTFLLNLGYPGASLDSVVVTDSMARLLVFLGPKYKDLELGVSSKDWELAKALGWKPTKDSITKLSFANWLFYRSQIMAFFENNGHPFAIIRLDSVQLLENLMKARLAIDEGVAYKFDSVSFQGKLKLGKRFVYSYLDIKPGEPFSRKKIEMIDRRLGELNYVQTKAPAEIVYLGSGAFANLFVDEKKSSQVDILFGLLPPTGEVGTKMQFIYDLKLNLRNTFGAGEGIRLTAQKLRQSSPRINLGYDQGYILGTKFGVDAAFDLYKQDSNFLQILAKLGASYVYDFKQRATVFFQLDNSALMQGAIDTNIVRSFKRLPTSIDTKVYNFGINYLFSNTNYRLNPTSGNEIEITGTAGIKKILPSQEVLALKDPNFNYASLYDRYKLKTFQAKFHMSAAHYFRLNLGSTVKASLMGGFISSDNVFRNELFQVDDYKIIRGFDDESIFASQWAVLSAEYRKLIGINSYLFGFVDHGLAKAKYLDVDKSNSLTGVGLGILYETKAGLLNLSFAIGKRSDTDFKLRNAAKIHVGYVNYF